MKGVYDSFFAAVLADESDRTDAVGGVVADKLINGPGFWIRYWTTYTFLCRSNSREIDNG